MTKLSAFEIFDGNLIERDSVSGQILSEGEEAQARLDAWEKELASYSGSAREKLANLSESEAAAILKLAKISA